MLAYLRIHTLIILSLISSSITFCSIGQIFNVLQTVATEKERIELGIKTLSLLPNLGESFVKLQLPELVTEIDRINNKTIAYEKSELPKLLKNFSQGLTDLIGKKDAFFIGILRVIGTQKALGVSKRLMDGSKAINGFVKLFSSISDIMLLHALIKNLPAVSPESIKTDEKLPEIAGDLEL